MSEPAPDGAGVTYCERWDRVAHVPYLPLTTAEARQRFEHGPWFTVVIPVEAPEGTTVEATSAPVAEAPDVVLEVEAGLTTVTAVFFDDETGGVVGEYVFRRHGDALFFAAGTQFDAPDDGRPGRSAAVRTQEIFVQTDGTLDVVVDERGSDGLQVVDDGTIDVASYWEPLPAFGAWGGLARFER